MSRRRKKAYIDPIDLIRQYQENEVALRNELKAQRFMMSAMVLKQGGHVVLTPQDLILARADLIVTRIERPSDGSIELSVREADPKPFLLGDS